MTKVFIALPCGELSRFSSFWKSREGLNFEGLKVTAGQAQSPYIDNNQNILARLMRESDADYFWLLNDDLNLPPNTLQQLVAHGKDVVVPLVLGHNVPHEPLFYDRREGDHYHHRFLRPGDRGLQRGIGSGGGGQLISRRVFDAFPDPWWETHMSKSLEGIPVRSTEDLDFCRKLEDSGFDIWCDFDAPVGHITIFNVWPVRLADGSWGTSYERVGKHVIIPAAINPDTVKREEILVT